MVLRTKKNAYSTRLNFSLKFGTGGIRTHDQGIMSPLRYRCATVPDYLIFYIFDCDGGSLLPSLSKMIINHFLGRVPQSQIYCFWNLSAVVPTFPLRNDNQSFLRQSANSPRFTGWKLTKSKTSSLLFQIIIK